MTTPEHPNNAPSTPPAAPAQGPAPVLTQLDPTSTGDAPTPAPARKPLNKTHIIAAASFIVGAMLGIAGTAATTSAVTEANEKAAAKAEAEKPRPLKDALSSCGLLSAKGAQLGDGDTSLSLDGKGEDDSTGLPIGDINCVLKSVKIPDFVRTQMDKTRALDGTQRESWGNFNATWSYHPNTGVNVGLTEK